MRMYYFWAQNSPLRQIYIFFLQKNVSFYLAIFFLRYVKCKKLLERILNQIILKFHWPRFFFVFLFVFFFREKNMLFFLHCVKCKKLLERILNQIILKFHRPRFFFFREYMLVRKHCITKVKTLEMFLSN